MPSSTHQNEVLMTLVSIFLNVFTMKIAAKKLHPFEDVSQRSLFCMHSKEPPKVETETEIRNVLFVVTASACDLTTSSDACDKRQTVEYLQVACRWQTTWWPVSENHWRYIQKWRPHLLTCRRSPVSGRSAKVASLWQKNNNTKHCIRCQHATNADNNWLHISNMRWVDLNI